MFGGRALKKKTMRNKQKALVLMNTRPAEELGRREANMTPDINVDLEDELSNSTLGGPERLHSN
jgi:hypothetical protein